MKQQQKHQSKYPILEYETQNMFIIITYIDKIPYKIKKAKAKIIIVPKVRLYNAPLEIQLKGVYNLENAEQKVQSLGIVSGLEITQSFVFEKEEKVQQKDLIKKSQQQFQQEKPQQAQKQSQKGQKFLQGCQVFYQLDHSTKKRLQILQQKTQYLYPIQFELPQNLPHTIDQFILKGIYLSVKYQLNVSIRSIAVQNNRKMQEYYILPFSILPDVKIYPYEQLVIKQKIRCYHGLTSQNHQKDNKPKSKCLRYLCPQFLLGMIVMNKSQIIKFSQYDLHHLELIVVVSQNSNIFLIARSYKEPDANMMSVIKKKQFQQATSYIQQYSMGEMPTIKQSIQNRQSLKIRKVWVEMYAQWLGETRQLIFKKMIILNNRTYDMIQGEIMVNLDEYLLFSKSYKSDVFTLNYSFNIKGQFADDEEVIHPYQDVVIQEHKNDLIL